MVTQTAPQLKHFVAQAPSAEAQPAKATARYDWRSDWRIGAAFVMINAMLILLVARPA